MFRFMQESTPKPADIRFSAMNYLARREHSVKELKEKLSRKFIQSELVDGAIGELVAQGLQSDERFAQAFVGMRQRQGKGPVVIALELREKGVNSELIEQFVDSSASLWFELAREVRSKKYRGAAPIDQRERAKQMRFLHSRGFSSRHIQAAFGVHNDDEY
jgi:regulatory protein